MGWDPKYIYLVVISETEGKYHHRNPPHLQALKAKDLFLNPPSANCALTNL